MCFDSGGLDIKTAAGMKWMKKVGVGEGGMGMGLLSFSCAPPTETTNVTHFSHMNMGEIKSAAPTTKKTHRTWGAQR